LNAPAGRRVRFFWLPLMVAGLLAGCNTMVAQNPSSPMRPVNAVRDGDESRLVLRGYDVVAYSLQGRAVPGDRQFSATYEGATYRFSSAEHLAAFRSEPSRFQPAYHGFDATGIVFAIPEAADPTVWRVAQGRVFVFADAASKAAFELDLERNIALADRYWQDEVAGSFSSWQALKRRVDRVPHYRSRGELAREVAAAQAKAG
jgi:YHS domain-containing protein